jgi:hypothetical protein
MSKTTERTTDEQPTTDIEPACRTSLTSTDSEWHTKDAAVYPPGYPRLCASPDCFGPAYEAHEQDDEGKLPGFDHTDAVDVFVRSTLSTSTSLRFHRPAPEVGNGD